MVDTGLSYAEAFRDKGDDDVQEESDGATAAWSLALLCVGTASQSPETRLLREEARREVRRSLTFLSARDRKIVELRYFEGQAFFDIGQAIGVHEDTARKRHKDALKRLGAILRPVFLGL